MRYTPGPWFYNYESGDIFEVRDSKDNPATEIANNVDVKNGILIALAPELLEILKALLADIEDYQRINHLGGENNQSQVNARAIIKKVEGR